MATMTQPGTVREPVGSPTWSEVTDWLYTEAELLDDGLEREWLRRVSEDVVYQVPIRQTVERARGNGVAEGCYHLDERYGSLESRVHRNETSWAWAEDPPSRTRHFVTNVRVARRDDGCLTARSSILIYRTRWDQTTPHLMAGERHDVLRREEERLKLLERTVILDLSSIGTHNLALFF